MQLYKRLRREYEQGVGTIRGGAQKYNVHRRTVRAALENAVRPKRKLAPREQPKMARAIPVIDAIMNSDSKTQKCPSASDIRRIRSGSCCKSRYRDAMLGNRLC